MRKQSLAKRLLLVTLGVFIMTSGLHWFLIPSNLAVGGISGLGMVLNAYVPHIPVGAIIGVINILLLVIAYLVIGREFLGLTVYSSILMSALLLLFEWLVPATGVLVHDLLLNLIFGILITGIGMGIVFNQNASTGGTDIIAKIINMYLHMDIGKSLLMVDFVIALMAGLTFGARIGLYAVLGVILNSLIIDQMIAGLTRKVSIMVITKEVDKVNDFLHRDLDRGGTIFEARGGFTGEDRPVILTILSRPQYLQLRQFVQRTDPFAFMIVNYIHEVEGEGFTR